MKRAIVYYSLSENTRQAAEAIAAGLEADVIRIDVVKPMPTEFKKQIMFGGMQVVFGLKPAIKGVPENLASYDEILIGTPIWAGRHCPAIHTLLQDKEIASKVTAVFTLDGGGENKKAKASLQKLLPNLKQFVTLKDHKLGMDEENRKQIAMLVFEMK